jgi:hypothetical protein
MVFPNDRQCRRGLMEPDRCVISAQFQSLLPAALRTRHHAKFAMSLSDKDFWLGPIEHPNGTASALVELMTGGSMVNLRRLAFRAGVIALGVLPLVACGSDRAGLNTAPSAVPGSTTSLSAWSAQVGTFSARDRSADPAGRLSGESTVTSLVAGTTCPTLTFMMGTYKIAVAATTAYTGGTCADIVVDARLRVTGTKRVDDSILASDIEVQNGPHAQNVEGEGIITGLKTGTSCPALAFFVESKQVTVAATTAYARGACDDLAIGKRVHVKGTMTADGNVEATSIQVQSNSPGFPVVEGDGQVSSLVSGTSCPTLKFMSGEWTVTLDSSTVFTNGSCTDVAVGRKVGVKGTVTAEHQVLATRIVFKADDGN